MEKTLKSGNYMKVESVQDFVNHVICRSSLSGIINKVCKVYENESNKFYNTVDLKSIMMPDLFREMECQVITLMIK
jgi:hypothetical protein